jgi:hypothetical protein
LVEQLTFNQWVTGSNPVRLTTEINDLADFGEGLICFWVTNGLQKTVACLCFDLSSTLLVISPLYTIPWSEADHHPDLSETYSAAVIL